MRKDLVDITLVVDRSGSMESIREDAQGGINAFIRDQSESDGEALVTLVQFDTQYEFVHRGVPVQDVPEFKLVPRGGTALLDAVGRAINETGNRLDKMAESDRPGLVIFVVMTDGQENSSCEFKLADIRKMIQHQQDAYSWQFTFLGADQDAFAEAQAMGMAAGGHGNYAKHKVMNAYIHASSKVKRMRCQAAAGASVDNKFTQEELDDMAD